MKYRKTLKFDPIPTKPWKYIIVDAPLAHGIYLNDQEVGRFLLRPEIWKGNMRALLIEGIEIEPEFRGRGIGRAVVRMFLEQCDVFIGSITEDDCKPFWQAMKATFIPLPLDCFPKETLHTIHTKEPMWFYIAKTPEAKALAEEVGNGTAEMMREMVKQGI